MIILKSLWFYDELKKRKQDGEVFNFRKISQKQLMELFWIQGWSDRMIAEIYDCSVSEVVHKRNRLNITSKNIPVQLSDRPRISHQVERVRQLFHQKEPMHQEN
ncbi:hypothetical protein [Neobacillus vireti]|uniref:hypothetical protein n=1 Tax=Neobacillus vireti TaxID=220686 RepID=UPI002FFF78B4